MKHVYLILSGGILTFIVAGHLGFWPAVFSGIAVLCFGFFIEEVFKNIEVNVDVETVIDDKSFKSAMTKISEIKNNAQNN